MFLLTLIFSFVLEAIKCLLYAVPTTSGRMIPYTCKAFLFCFSKYNLYFRQTHSTWNLYKAYPESGHKNCWTVETNVPRRSPVPDWCRENSFWDETIPIRAEQSLDQCCQRIPWVHSSSLLAALSGREISTICFSNIYWRRFVWWFEENCLPLPQRLHVENTPDPTKRVQTWPKVFERATYEHSGVKKIHPLPKVSQIH